MLSVPVAIISVVDHDRIWFRSHHGTDVTEIGRDPGLCASAVLQGDAWMLRDAVNDPRTLANPLVSGEFGLQLYAACRCALRTATTWATLCILDREPREFSDEDTGGAGGSGGARHARSELRLHSRRALAG